MINFKQTSKWLAVLVLAVAITIGCKKTIDQEHDVLKAEKMEVSSISSLQGSSAFCNAESFNPTAKQYGIARPVAQSSNVNNTDYVSAGVGDLRNKVEGAIAINVGGTVTKAYLYWHGISNSTTEAGNTITLNGTAVTGTNIGYSSSNCWPSSNSQAYRAEVTSLIASGASSYFLTDFDANLNLNGASLIVFFDDGNPLNNRNVYIFDGNDSNVFFAGISGNTNAPADPSGWDAALNGINYSSGTANLQLHVADGQEEADNNFFKDDALKINGITFEPAGNIFAGVSVPGLVGGSIPNGRLWDIKNWDITSFFSVGSNNLNLTTGLLSDCLGLIVALIDLPTTDLQIPFDVKPTSCPNPLNVIEKGTLPTAILGSASLDVSKIDISTIKINGVSPKEWYLEDVATPSANTCNNCTIDGPDGFMDLVLKFESQAIVASLGATADGECRSLKVTGNLTAANGGLPINGEDFIRIVKKKK